MRSKRFKNVILVICTSFLSFFVPANILAAPELSVITEIVGELYDKVSKNPDNQQLGSILFSLKPQLIWKSERSLLLVNLQIFGDLGGMKDSNEIDGHFGKEDVLGISVKPDTFYRTFLGQSNFYFKAGKYTAEIPFQFGGELVTGQIEAGFNKTDKLRIYWDSIFYEWYKTDPFSNGKQKVIQLLAVNWYFPNIALKLYYPLLISENMEDIRQYPSFQFQYKQNSFTNDLFTGFAYRKNELGETGIIFALREELSFSYNQYWQTYGLYSLLSAGKKAEDSYEFTSVDDQTPILGYGNHFDYIYEEVGNSFGIHTFGIKQQFQAHPVAFWIEAGSYFTYKSGSGSNNYIGTAVRGDLKWFNPWGDGSLVELLAAAFFPGGFTEISGTQTYNAGFQLIVKLQHSF